MEKTRRADEAMSRIRGLTVGGILLAIVGYILVALGTTSGEEYSDTDPGQILWGVLLAATGGIFAIVGLVALGTMLGIAAMETQPPPAARPASDRPAPRPGGRRPSPRADENDEPWTWKSTDHEE